MNRKIASFLFNMLLVHALVFAVVSCNKDERSDHDYETGSVRDIDGNIYQTLILDSREWMTENLRTTRFNDGSRIAHPGTDNPAWINNRSGAYSWYNNDISNKDTYGALYNWHAVNTGKLCPTGWRVPGDTEWTSVNNLLAMNAGGKIKDNISGKWQVPDPAATNETGFNALPGGVRFAQMPGGSGNTGTGYFYYAGKTGRWWSSTENSASDAWYRSLYFDSGSIFSGYNSKETGFSVRCIR
jgi:uncharacterized protein (TIGR02145 family)